MTIAKLVRMYASRFLGAFMLLGCYLMVVNDSLFLWFKYINTPLHLFSLAALVAPEHGMDYATSFEKSGLLQHNTDDLTQQKAPVCSQGIQALLPLPAKGNHCNIA